MNGEYAFVPHDTFWYNSWIDDREAREFFIRLVRDMGHGYMHANAAKPVYWYRNVLYGASTNCADYLDPAQNYFTTTNFGRGYDVDGVFEYGGGDGLVDKEFKMHGFGYNLGFTTIPVWQTYLERNGTLRYHFRDFIDWVGEQFPAGTITIVDIFNEIYSCNGGQSHFDWAACSARLASGIRHTSI